MGKAAERKRKIFQAAKGTGDSGRREGEEQDFLGRASVVLWHPEHLRVEMEFQRVI